MGEAGFAASKHLTEEPGMATEKIFPFRNDLAFKLVFGQEVGTFHMPGTAPWLTRPMDMENISIW